MGEVFTDPEVDGTVHWQDRTEGEIMPGKLSVENLNGPGLTLLFPLYARALETAREDALFQDRYAVEMVRQIDFDFRRFDRMPEGRSFGRKDMLTGIAVRTRLIDSVVLDVLRDQPRVLVVNLGCGLDARFFRLDNGQMGWIDVDVEEVIALRRMFFDESERYQMLAASVLDPGWLDLAGIQNDRPTLFVAEGTLMYFQPRQVEALFNRLAERCPGAVLCFEVMGSGLAGKIHPTVRCLDREIVCPWGIDDYESLEAWHPGLKLASARLFVDHHRGRWSLRIRLLARLFAGQKRRYGGAIVRMNISADEEKEA
jgi:methyltransferase (TIGR00027 family)